MMIFIILGLTQRFVFLAPAGSYPAGDIRQMDANECRPPGMTLLGLCSCLSIIYYRYVAPLGLKLHKSY